MSGYGPHSVPAGMGGFRVTAHNPSIVSGSRAVGVSARAHRFAPSAVRFAGAASKRSGHHTHPAAIGGRVSSRTPAPPPPSAPPSSRVALRPVAASKVRLSTVAAGSSEITREVADKDRTTMDSAFTQIKSEVRKAYPQMKYLEIDLNTLVFRLYDKDNRQIGEPLGFDEIRAKISSKAPRVAGQVSLADEFDRRIGELREVTSNSGLVDIWPYSSRGKDARGNIIGGKALQTQTPIVQEKQVEDLRYGLDNAGCVPAILAQVRDSDPKRMGRKRSKAASRILQVEAFHIKLREKLKEKIAALGLELLAAPTDKTKLQQQQALQRLLEQIEGANRHALYYAAAFVDHGRSDSERADKCYDAVIDDLYSAAVAKMKQPMTKAQFLGTQEGIACKEYAADVASTFISKAADYKRFCLKHNVYPKQDHINVFLIQAFRKQEISYNAISIGFDDATKRQLAQIIKQAHRASSPAALAITGAPPDHVAAMKAKIEAQAALFVDPKTPQGTARKARNVWASVKPWIPFV